MRVDILTGSRAWAGDRAVVRKLLEGCDMLIVGDCKTGGDQVALEEALKADIIVKQFFAADFGSWPSCGPKRNSGMVKFGVECREFAQVVGHALWWPVAGNRGTTDCWRKMKLAGIEIVAGAEGPPT